MGSRYILFRVFYLYKVKTRLLEKQIPHREFNSLDCDYFPSLGFKYPKIKSVPKVFNSNRIIRGELKFFNNTWYTLGSSFDWVTNLDSGHRYHLIHWSQIADLDKKSGDIKYVWEPSRFSWAIELIRSNYFRGNDYSEFIFQRMDSWIEGNPINLGPNYICSQEMALRIWNWSIILDFYSDSESLNSSRLKKYQDSIYGHLHHIYKNISFSRKAVRNNHAITETAILFISRWLFPFIPEAEKWSRKAEKWFNKEIEYQIYEDGTFLQFSMNYHRVVIQILSGVISTALKHDYKLSPRVLEKSYSSVKFLYACMGNEEKGLLPNYGQNDGALFFPWTSLDYRDYRPQLNALHFILTGKDLWDIEEVKEERMWWGSKSINENIRFKPIVKSYGVIQFPIGGYVVVRKSDVMIFFRNGNHKDRPAQADNQHIDLWYNGENLLFDAGTYKYNTSSDLVKWFFGSDSHNVAQLGENDQMLKGGRFIWYYWTQSRGLAIEETDQYIKLTGVISAFRYLRRRCKIERTITIPFDKNHIDVEDRVIGKPDNYDLRQNWLFDKGIEIKSEENIEYGQGLVSYYYGQKQKCSQARVISSSDIVATKIKF